MFIAMNRFRVIKDAAGDFETLWQNRQSHLPGMQGFVAFHMLRGPEREDHRLYSSHTVWESREAFEAWTTSEAFRASHRGAGGTKPLYLGHPEFEGFDVIQTIPGTPSAGA